MAGTDLIFSAPPAPGQPVNLVFNDGEGVPSTDVVVSIAGSFPKLHGRAIIGAPARVSISGVFNRLQGSVRVFYNSDTQRPMVGAVVDNFQIGEPLEVNLSGRMQDALRLQAVTTGRFQDAAPLRTSLSARWQQSRRMGKSLYVLYQQALRARASLSNNFTDAQHVRRAVADSYQQGLKVGNRLAGRFQSAHKGRAAVVDHYQRATPYVGGSLVSRAQRAQRISASTYSRFQDAIRAPGGLWFRPPPVDPGEPCYVPSADLMFFDAWSDDTNLVFLCERHGTGPVDPEPGDTVVIPIREVYMIFNNVTLRRVEGDIALPTLSMSMSLDVDSWTWTFNASLPARAKQYVERNSNGDPVEVEAVINGVPYRMLVESISRRRSFGQESLSIGGRGLSATLDAPYSPVMNFGNTAERSAQQLMQEVLTQNGVSIGWGADWLLDDWQVPGNVWTHQGSRISALQSIVGAAGGYLQPVPSAQTLRALPRYPTAPWNWGDVTPDFELPSAITTQEGIDWVEKARYDRVFVSGVNAGVLGQVTRAGTGGTLVAPMVTDSLITSGVAARQRGTAVLSDTGRIATVSLRVPVMTETGVIPPGKFVRYVDNGVTRIGLTRSVSLDVAMPEVFQTLAIETHE